MSEVPRPAVDGWYAAEPEPHLIGSRCTTCGTTVFPPTRATCPDPSCEGEEFEPAPLPRTATVWSWTTNHYPPPPPAVSSDPFVPYTVVAAALDGLGTIVLGRLVPDADPAALRIGARVEVEVAPDVGGELVWWWRPAADQPAGDADTAPGEEVAP